MDIPKIHLEEKQVHQTKTVKFEDSLVRVETKDGMLLCAVVEWEKDGVKGTRIDLTVPGILKILEALNILKLNEKDTIKVGSLGPARSNS